MLIYAAVNEKRKTCVNVPCGCTTIAAYAGQLLQLFNYGMWVTYDVSFALIVTVVPSSGVDSPYVRDRSGISREVQGLDCRYHGWRGLHEEKRHSVFLCAWICAFSLAWYGKTRMSILLVPYTAVLIAPSFWDTVFSFRISQGNSLVGKYRRW